MASSATAQALNLGYAQKALSEQSTATIFYPPHAAKTPVSPGQFQMSWAQDVPLQRDNGRLIGISQGSGGTPWEASTGAGTATARLCGGDASTPGRQPGQRLRARAAELEPARCRGEPAIDLALQLSEFDGQLAAERVVFSAGRQSGPPRCRWWAASGRRRVFATIAWRTSRQIVPLVWGL